MGNLLEKDKKKREKEVGEAQDNKKGDEKEDANVPNNQKEYFIWS